MILFRISGNLYRTIQNDLRRPHEFAAERIGFLFVRPGKLAGADVLLLGAEYLPVLDKDYVDDLTVGARINGDAIRMAMQKVLDTRQGCFHVHLHEHKGKPRFSGTDNRELKVLIPTFRQVGTANYHGALLLSDDSACAVALPPDEDVFTDDFRITFIGPPMQIT